MNGYRAPMRYIPEIARELREPGIAPFSVGALW